MKELTIKELTMKTLLGGVVGLATLLTTQSASAGQLIVNTTIGETQTGGVREIVASTYDETTRDYYTFGVDYRLCGNENSTICGVLYNMGSTRVPTDVLTGLFLGLDSNTPSVTQIKMGVISKGIDYLFRDELSYESLYTGLNVGDGGYASNECTYKLNASYPTAIQNCFGRQILTEQINDWYTKVSGSDQNILPTTNPISTIVGMGTAGFGYFHVDGGQQFNNGIAGAISSEASKPIKDGTFLGNNIAFKIKFGGALNLDSIRNFRFQFGTDFSERHYVVDAPRNPIPPNPVPVNQVTVKQVTEPESILGLLMVATISLVLKKEKSTYK